MTKANAAKNTKPYKKRIKRRGKAHPLNYRKKMGPKNR